MSCGFEPIYGTNKPANLIVGKIDVEVSNGRNAFELRDRLIERLGALEGPPTYLLNYTSNIESKNLTISKDNDVTRYTLQGVTNFDLVNIASKKVIYTNNIASNTAYSATAGTYPTAIAERDANVRLSRDMADKIVTLLLITAKDWVE
ncbi:LPS assembly lipoprotein LptE [Amylibacter sp.]|nr:LPS assembly lipoprotein LptE [Amylibacter sp.]MDB9860699.1 LPS assembly lipoprotein LptE [Amylibacter sp.]